MQNNNISELHNKLCDGGRWLNISREVKPEDLAGRIILLDFWTYCCINCMQVLPDLEHLESKYGGKLLVIGVHSAKFKNEQESENILSAARRYGIKHPIINDSDFKIWKSFGVRAWPTLILLSPEGRLLEAFSGEGHGEALDDLIGMLVKKYGDKLNTSEFPYAKPASSNSMLNFPGKIEYAPDFKGKPTLFISDSGNHRIVATDMEGKLLLEIGDENHGDSDGTFKTASFNKPQGVLYNNGFLFIADTGNHKLRLADLEKGTVKTIAGTGERGTVYKMRGDVAPKTPLASPWDLAFYPNKKQVVIANAGTHQLIIYDSESETLTTFAGNGRESIDDGRYPYNSLSQPSGLSIYQNALFFVDSETSSLRVIENGEINTLIGSGLFDFGFHDGGQGAALMQHPIGLDATDKGVYIADSYNHAIRHYDYKTRKLTTAFKGAEAFKLNEPHDVMKIDDKLYIADTNNNRIVVMDIVSSDIQELKIQQ